MSKYAVNGKEPIAVWIPSLDNSGNGTTTLTDLVGSNNGTLTGMDPATDWVSDTGAGGVRALDFDGSNDVVIMGPPAITQQMAQSYWFKRGQASTFGPFVGFGRAGDASNRFVIWPWVDGRIYIVIGAFDSGDFISNDLNWHHIICSFDGAAVGNANRLKVWFDGVATTLRFSGNIGSSIGTPTLTRIGQTPGNDIFGRGRSDDYRIFGTTLDAADAAYLWNGGSGRGITAGSGIIPILRQHYAAQGAR
jgi:hypothetical protein